MCKIFLTDSNEGGVIEHLHQQLFMERENVRQLRQQNEQAEKVAIAVRFASRICVFHILIKY